MVIALICSSRTIRPASLAGSLSAGPFASDFDWAGGTNISFKRGMIFSVKGRRPEGSNSMILKTFCKIKDKSSRSFISSSNAGSTFLSRTDFGNEGSTLDSPRMNCDFSFGVLAGRASRNRIVEIRILSKYALCWNSSAVIRWIGFLVISRGSTDAVRSFGMGRDERKPLLGDGIVDEDENNLLYVVMLELASRGEVCGELYRATIRRPRENMSAAMLRLESRTKSGEQ